MTPDAELRRCPCCGCVMRPQSRFVSGRLSVAWHCSAHGWFTLSDEVGDETGRVGTRSRDGLS